MVKKLLLIIILLVGIFMPKIVFAEGDIPFPESLIVGVGEEEYDLLAGDEIDGVSYDADTHTLELNDFKGKYIKSTNITLDIVLKGENTLSGAGDYDNLNLSGAIYSISGNGSLDITNDENKNIAVYTVGSLTINGGTININDTNTAMEIKGDLTINDGTLNITNCTYGLDLKMNTIDGDGNFIGNGGKVNITDCREAIGLFGSFKLNGTDMVFKSVMVGITSNEEMNRGHIEINKGSLIFKDAKESAIAAFAMGYDDEVTNIDEVIKFNYNDLYIDNPDYDFRIIPVTIEDYPMIYVVLGEDGITEDDFEGEGLAKFAKEVSILPKTKYEVVEGDKQTVYQKADSIKIDADLEKFVALYINDELVDDANYELSSGSTIIKLKDEYVKKLSAGNYKFKVVFNDGVAEGTFEIAGANPNTGDSIFISIILLGISILGIVFFRKQVKKM